MTKGYVLVSNNRAMYLDKKTGLLYFASTATLFETRKAANEAKYATLAYDKDRDWVKDFGEIRVERLT